ncbi:MAG: hypothetical protein QQN63_00145 [Nitrosopumilus sp.]
MEHDKREDERNAARAELPQGLTIDPIESAFKPSQEREAAAAALPEGLTMDPFSPGSEREAAKAALPEGLTIDPITPAFNPQGDEGLPSLGDPNALPVEVAPEPTEDLTPGGVLSSVGRVAGAATSRLGDLVPIFGDADLSVSEETLSMFTGTTDSPILKPFQNILNSINRAAVGAVGVPINIVLGLLDATLKGGADAGGQLALEIGAVNTQKEADKISKELGEVAMIGEIFFGVGTATGARAAGRFGQVKKTREISKAQEKTQAVEKLKATSEADIRNTVLLADRKTDEIKGAADRLAGKDADKLLTQGDVEAPFVVGGSRRSAQIVEKLAEEGKLGDTDLVISREARNDQKIVLQDAIRNTQRKLGEVKQNETSIQKAANVRDSIKVRAEAAKTEIDEAYEAAGKTDDVFLPAENIQGFSEFIRDATKTTGEISFKRSPIKDFIEDAKRIEDEARTGGRAETLTKTVRTTAKGKVSGDVVRKISQDGKVIKTEKRTTGGAETVKELIGAETRPAGAEVSVSQLRDLRDSLSPMANAQGIGQGPARVMRKAIDNFLDENADALTGNKDSIGLWRDAISKRAQFGRTFEDSPIINDIINKRLDDIEVTNKIIGGAKGTLSNRANQNLDDIKKSFGADSAEYKNLQSALALKPFERIGDTISDIVALDKEIDFEVFTKTFDELMRRQKATFKNHLPEAVFGDLEATNKVMKAISANIKGKRADIISPQELSKWYDFILNTKKPGSGEFLLSFKFAAARLVGGLMFRSLAKAKHKSLVDATYLQSDSMETIIRRIRDINEREKEIIAVLRRKNPNIEDPTLRDKSIDAMQKLLDKMKTREAAAVAGVSGAEALSDKQEERKVLRVPLTRGPTKPNKDKKGLEG